MKLHKHKCEYCPESFSCTLDCNKQSDGGSVCAKCALQRFDEIVPQEKAKLR